MRMKMWCYVILVATIITLGSGQEVCLSANRNPYLLFGTKTSYTFANQGIPATRVHDVVGCQPKAIWLLSRHGSNNPEANEISDLQSLVHLKKNIQENYRNGNFRNTNQRICEADLQLLDRWDWNPRINATFAGDLTSDGYLTTQQLADAWRKRFPGLLTDNRHDYLFKFADDKRSTTSFHAFLEGLFKDQAELRGYDIPKENDAKLLKPFENCPSWINKVQNNNETYTQLGIFEGKREYQEMIKNVSLRLGFNYDIDKDTFKRMYNMCRYNKAWDVAQISPWCSVFDQEDLKRLEYAEDLESYYKYGYGSQINQNVGCPLVRDMMNFFKKHIENEVPQQPRSSVLLGEATSLLAAVTSLRGRRDAVPLTGDNYHSSAQRARRWTTSTLAPFNANLAAILYTCTPNGNFQIKDKHQVLFLENEQPMYLEGCRVGLCEWSYVVEHYGEFANKCDTNVCNGATSRNIFIATTLAILAFLITVFV